MEHYDINSPTHPSLGDPDDLVRDSRIIVADVIEHLINLHTLMNRTVAVLKDV